MAVRSSMAALIARTRQMIGDVASPVDFSDQDIQDACDAHRDDVRYELLSPAPDIQPGQNGSQVAEFVWAAFFSHFQHWEDDVLLQGMNTTTEQPWVILTPVASEPIVGRWTFAVTLPAIATPPGQWPPVYASGKVYDLYRIAADLLERRIALRSFTTFDITADGRTLHLNQILDRWEKLRVSYLAQSWNRVVDLQRTDMAADRGNGQTTPLLSGGTRDDILPGMLGGNVIRGNGGY